MVQNFFTNGPFDVHVMWWPCEYPARSPACRSYSSPVSSSRMWTWPSSRMIVSSPSGAVYGMVLTPLVSQPWIPLPERQIPHIMVPVDPVCLMKNSSPQSCGPSASSQLNGSQSPGLSLMFEKVSSFDGVAALGLSQMTQYFLKNGGLVSHSSSTPFGWHMIVPGVRWCCFPVDTTVTVASPSSTHRFSSPRGAEYLTRHEPSGSQPGAVEAARHRPDMRFPEVPAARARTISPATCFPP